jgi:hypothetical protein
MRVVVLINYLAQGSGDSGGDGDESCGVVGGSYEGVKGALEVSDS